jgi:hypothetical protein
MKRKALTTIQRKAHRVKTGFFARKKAIQSGEKAIRHKSRDIADKTKYKFTAQGGVYSWKRLKVSLGAGFVLFLVMTLFIGNVTVPIVSDITQYWILIGTQTGGGGHFQEYGSPQSFIRVMSPMDPSNGKAVGPDFYLLNPFGIILSYLFLVFVAYLILTISSDFNFGGRKNARRSIFALVVLSLLVLMPLAAAEWQTIFEQNTSGGGVYMNGAGWYHKQTFTNLNPLSNQRIKYEMLLSKTGSSFTGMYTYKITLPGGASYEIDNYISTLQSSQHWESVTTSDAFTCSQGTGSIYFGISQTQPSQSFIYTYTKAGDPYTGGVFIWNHGSGEQTDEYSDMAARAYKEYNPIQVTLTMGVSPSGTGTTTPSPGTHQYDQGTTVHCTATANSGYHFEHWSGSYTGTQNPYDILMNADKTMTAVFVQDPQPTYSLTMAASPSGAGTTNPSIGVHTGYHSGDQVTISATAATHYIFMHWTGTGSGSYSGSGNPHVLTFSSSSISETAVFYPEPTYTLTMAASPSGAGTTSPAIGPHPGYYTGNQVTISASAASGYTFSHWSGTGTGSYSGTDNSHTITFDYYNIGETANFVATTHTLTMGVAPSGSGSTSPSVGGHPYQHGAVVDISASAGTGYSFSHWSGSGPGSYSGSTNGVSITINGDVTETANFISDITYSLDITIGDGEGTTNPSAGSHTYPSGEQVQCTAYPAEHYHFRQWTGSYTGAQNPYIITMNSAKYLTANFDPDVYTLTITVDGQGTVSKYPNGPYEYNDEVSLMATASSGWNFDHWGGDISGNEDPAYIYMTEDKEVTAYFTQMAIPPEIQTFKVNQTSLKTPGNVTIEWTTIRADAVHLFLNNIDQGEFDPSSTVSILIDRTTEAKIEATGAGGTAGSTVITITVGEGQMGGGTGFNYNWLLLIIIPVGLILLDRWLKKKPPFGKKDGEKYYTINIGDELQKVTGKKKKTKAEKTRTDQAKDIAKKTGARAKVAAGQVRDVSKKALSGLREKMRGLFKRE